jgi:protein-L-isoaspartate(D-aspartate) O-methyltransferase
MLEPKVEARLLQDVHIQRPREGAGSRHRLGLHGRPAGRRAQRVITLEIESRTGRLARENLQRAGIPTPKCARPTAPWACPAEGPFDVIVLSGSVAEVPQNLLQQLKVGGRLAAIVGEEPMMRATFITRTGDAVHHHAAWDTWRRACCISPNPSRFKF